MKRAMPIRQAQRSDLDAINRVVEAAVMTWDLPERVKRLSLSSYRYTGLDFDHGSFWVAENEQRRIVGVAVCESADKRDAPAGKSAMLLHGLYVQPDYHRQGIGKALLQAVVQFAQKQGMDGLLVKAQAEAAGFFEAQGMQKLAVEDSGRDYAKRYWKPFDGKKAVRDMPTEG